MPASRRNFATCSGPRVSRLTATISNSSPPSLAWSRSSAGISRRQGTHQVAQRLSRTVRPRQSESLRSRPSASVKTRSGRGRARSATVKAATSPRASGRSAASAGAEAGHAAPLPATCRVPYSAPSPATTAPTNPIQSFTRDILAMTQANKMWGGRFAASPDSVMEAINASIDVDRKLYAQDIAGSKAHAEMLAARAIISPEDARQIIAGLDQVRDEIERGEFVFSRALEDIHMNVEARL